MVMQVYGSEQVYGDIDLYENVGITKIGHHIAEKSGEGHLHFFAHNEFTDGLTMVGPQVINAYSFTERLVYQSDNTGSFTGTLLEYTIPSAIHVITKKFYLQTDATAATQPFRVQIWEGTDDTGTLITDQTYLANELPSSSEVALDIDGYQEYDAGVTYFLRYTSDANFSLKMDVINTSPWLAADSSLLREDDIFSTKQWVSGESWDEGDYYIYENKIYVCNVTGIQTGTFESNSDLWDDLSTDEVFRPTNSGLIYSMDFEQLGSVTQFDKGTKGLTTTIYNGAVVAADSGYMGSGIEFDNAYSQYAMTDGNLGISGNDPFTVQFRVKLDYPHSNTMINIGAGGNNGFSMFIGAWAFAEYGSLVSRNVTWRTGVQADTEWHQHTVTYDGTTLEWFLDGVSISTYTYTLNLIDSPFGIGYYPTAPSYHMHGKMSNVKVWDRVLTKEEWSAADVKDMGDSVVISDSFKVIGTDDVVNVPFDP